MSSSKGILLGSVTIALFFYIIYTILTTSTGFEANTEAETAPLNEAPLNEAPQQLSENIEKPQESVTNEITEAYAYNEKGELFGSEKLSLEFAQLPDDPVNPEPEVVADIIDYGDSYSCDQFEALKKIADKGAAEEMFVVGVMYFRGVCVKTHFGLAFSYFNSAAMQEHVSAYYNAGFMMHRQLGMDYSTEIIENGFEIIKDLADQGHPESIEYLKEINYNQLKN